MQLLTPTKQKSSVTLAQQQVTTPIYESLKVLPPNSIIANSIQPKHQTVERAKTGQRTFPLDIDLKQAKGGRNRQGRYESLENQRKTHITSNSREKDRRSDHSLPTLKDLRRSQGQHQNVIDHFKVDKTSIDFILKLDGFKMSRAPAIELEPHWGYFLEQSWKRQITPQIIKELVYEPNFIQITVLVLENLGIEKIFEFLKPCRRLRAVFLAKNRISTRDLVQIHNLHSLRKADLSSNDIVFLPEVEFIVQLQNLETLMLQDNKLVGWRQLETLICLKNLHSLALQGNPCAKIVGCRKHLVDNLPQLRSLDQFIVMDFERKDILHLFPPQNIRREKLRELDRFRPFNKQRTAWISWGFKSQMARNQIEFDQTSKVYRFSIDMNLIDQFLESEQFYLRRKFEHCSPVLTIQKTMRMKYYKLLYKRKRIHTCILVWVLKRWHLRSKLESLIKHMGLTREKLKFLGKVRLIQKRWRRYVQVKKIKYQTALKLQSIYRMRRAQNQNLPLLFGLVDAKKPNNPQNNSQVLPRLFFLKHQVDLIRSLSMFRFFQKIEQVKEFAIRRNLNESSLYHRKSSFLSLIRTSYHLVRVMQKGKSQSGSIIQNYAQRRLVETKFNLKPKLEPKRAHWKHKRKTMDQVIEYIETLDEKNELIAVTFDSELDLTDCYKQIMAYNQVGAKLIYCFLEPMAQRAKAIQNVARIVKGFQVRSNQHRIFDQSTGRLGKYVNLQLRDISSTNTIHSDYCVIMRAVRVIQKHVRAYKMRNRIQILTNIANYAADILTKEIYLEQNIYENLQKIHIQTAYRKTNEKSQQQALKRNRMKSSKIYGPEFREKIPKDFKRVGFMESLFEFDIYGPKFEVAVNFSKMIDPAGRYKYQTFPKWFLEKADTQIPLLSNDQKKQTMFKDHILALIHRQFYYEDEMAPKIVNCSELTSQIDFEELNKFKFLKIQCQSIQETKNRAILLALLTCDPKKGSGRFIKFHTERQIRDYPGKVFFEIQKGWQNNKITPKGFEIPLNHSDITDQQQANSMVIKRKEPFLTLLRSRPRKMFTQFERFVVLADADPQKVKKAIGVAMSRKKNAGLAPDKKQFRKDGSLKLDRLVQDKIIRRLDRRDSIIDEASVESLLIDPQTMSADEMQERKMQIKEENFKLLKLREMRRKLEKVKLAVKNQIMKDSSFKSLFVSQLMPHLDKQKQEEFNGEKEELEKQIGVLENTREYQGRMRSQSQEENEMLKSMGIDIQDADQVSLEQLLLDPTKQINSPENTQKAQMFTIGGGGSIQNEVPNLDNMSEKDLETQLALMYDDYCKQKDAYRKAVAVRNIKYGFQMKKKTRSNLLNSSGSPPLSQRNSNYLHQPQLKRDLSQKTPFKVKDSYSYIQSDEELRNSTDQDEAAKHNPKVKLIAPFQNSTPKMGQQSMSTVMKKPIHSSSLQTKKLAKFISEQQSQEVQALKNVGLDPLQKQNMLSKFLNLSEDQRLEVRKKLSNQLKSTTTAQSSGNSNLRQQVQTKKNDTILSKIIRSDREKLEDKLMRGVKEITKAQRISEKKQQKSVLNQTSNRQRQAINIKIKTMKNLQETPNKKAKITELNNQVSFDKEDNFNREMPMTSHLTSSQALTMETKQQTDAKIQKELQVVDLDSTFAGNSKINPILKQSLEDFKPTKNHPKMKTLLKESDKELATNRSMLTINRQEFSFQETSTSQDQSMILKSGKRLIFSKKGPIRQQLQKTKGGTLPTLDMGSLKTAEIKRPKKDNDGQSESIFEVKALRNVHLQESARNSLQSDLSQTKKKQAIFKDLEVMLENRERANSSEIHQEKPPQHYYAQNVENKSPLISERISQAKRHSYKQDQKLNILTQSSPILNQTPPDWKDFFVKRRDRKLPLVSSNRQKSTENLSKSVKQGQPTLPVQSQQKSSLNRGYLVSSQSQKNLNPVYEQPHMINQSSQRAIGYTDKRAQIQLQQKSAFRPRTQVQPLQLKDGGFQQQSAKHCQPTLNTSFRHSQRPVKGAGSQYQQNTTIEAIMERRKLNQAQAGSLNLNKSSLMGQNGRDSSDQEFLVDDLDLFKVNLDFVAQQNLQKVKRPRNQEPTMTFRVSHSNNNYDHPINKSTSSLIHESSLLNGLNARVNSSNLNRSSMLNNGSSATIGQGSSLFKSQSQKQLLQLKFVPKLNPSQHNNGQQQMFTLK